MAVNCYNDKRVTQNSEACQESHASGPALTSGITDDFFPSGSSPVQGAFKPPPFCCRQSLPREKGRQSLFNRYCQLPFDGPGVLLPALVCPDSKHGLSPLTVLFPGQASVETGVLIEQNRRLPGIPGTPYPTKTAVFFALKAGPQLPGPGAGANSVAKSRRIAFDGGELWS
jgi:hypothetical protein